MELINDSIKADLNFQILTKVFSYSYAHKNETKQLISYDEFKEVLASVIVKIMSYYLTSLDMIGNPTFVIKSLREGLFGYQTKDKIVMNESVIFGAFKGNLLEIFNICHELIHFKYTVDISKGVINTNILKIMKDSLIRKDGEDRCDFFKYDYYHDNYSLEYGEVIADLEGIELFRKLLLLMGIELKEADKIDLDKKYYLLKNEYNNKQRDFTRCSLSNKFYQKFDEWFDVIIKDHKDWIVDIPQLQIEYYLDEDGNVCKRTIDELKTLLETSSDEGTKEYVAYLLNPPVYQGNLKGKIKSYKHDSDYSKISNFNN